MSKTSSIDRQSLSLLCISAKLAFTIVSKHYFYPKKRSSISSLLCCSLESIVNAEMHFLIVSVDAPWDLRPVNKTLKRHLRLCTSTLSPSLIKLLISILTFVYLLTIIWTAFNALCRLVWAAYVKHWVTVWADSFGSERSLSSVRATKKCSCINFYSKKRMRSLSVCSYSPLFSRELI